MKPYAIQTKTTLYNNYTKYQQFSPPLAAGFKRRVGTAQRIAYRDGRALARSAQQRKRRVVDYVLANVSLAETARVRIKFVTLKPAVEYRTTELKQHNRNVTKFLQRVKYFTGLDKLQYIGIPEKNDSKKTSDLIRGTYHTHIFFFNIPYIPRTKLEEIYGQGFCDIRAVNTKDILRSAYYVAKYMTKAPLLNMRMMSANLRKPSTLYNDPRPDLTPVYESAIVISDTGTTVKTVLYKNNE